MTTLRTPLSYQVSGFVALMLALMAPGHLLGQDFFKQLQDKLGVQSDTSGTTTESPATEENLPAPIRPSSPADPLADPSAGVPALTPIPLPFEIGDPSPTQPAPSGTPATPSGTPATPADRPYLGITVEPILGGGMGLKIVDVTRDSPAWKAGISPGDQLMAIDSKALSNIDQLASEIFGRAPGDVVKCLIDRRGRTLTQPIVLGSSAIAEKSKIKIPDLPSYSPIGSALANEAANALQSAGTRPSLGVSVERLSENTKQQFGIPVYRGAIIVDVAANSPAMRAGLQPGDCIVGADGVVIQSESDLQTWMSKVSAGQIVALEYYRGQTIRTANIRLEARTPTASPQNNDPASPSDNSNAPVGTSPAANQPQIDELENRIQTMQQELERANRELEALRGNR